MFGYHGQCSSPNGSKNSPCKLQREGHKLLHLLRQGHVAKHCAEVFNEQPCVEASMERFPFDVGLRGVTEYLYHPVQTFATCY